MQAESEVQLLYLLFAGFVFGDSVLLCIVVILQSLPPQGSDSRPVPPRPPRQMSLKNDLGERTSHELEASSAPSAGLTMSLQRRKETHTRKRRIEKMNFV